MKWHKIEDYPDESDEYVLVSSKWNSTRFVIACFVGKKRGDCWLDDSEECCAIVRPTDRWCYIDLPED